MRKLSVSLCATIFFLGSASAEDLELVCDGAAIVYDKDGDWDGFPTMMKGTLIQIRENEVEVSGNVVFRGFFDLVAVDDAMYTFSDSETGFVGYLNRYSAQLNMMVDCTGDRCNGEWVEFSGTCSKQERRF